MVRALPAMLGGPMGDQGQSLAICCLAVEKGIDGRQIVKLVLGGPAVSRGVV